MADPRAELTPAIEAVRAAGLQHTVTRHGKVSSLAEAAARKVRALLGTNRLSMPDAETAREVTGYERGTITPFGSLRRLPVYADEHLRSRTISLGGGGHGVGLTLSGDDVITHFDAVVADLTE